MPHFALNKIAVVERVDQEVGVNRPFFMAEYAFPTKPKLQAHLDMLACYGSVKMTDDDGNPMSVKEFWKVNKGVSGKFAYIEYQEEGGPVFNYRVRMVGAY